MAILILGDHNDEHAVHVREGLRARGHRAEMLDSRGFPGAVCLTHDPRRDEWTIRLEDGAKLGPGEVSSIYWRVYNGIDLPDLPDEEQALIAGNDARSLFEAFLIRYPTRWVNGWAGYQLHQTKPAALAMVAALGYDIPATVTGNDAEAVRSFAAGRSRTIFKPVQGGAHARYVERHHLSESNLRNLALAPVTLQEEVGGTNIRAFVVGERVLACEVRASTLDFRDTTEPEIVPHALEAEIEERCRRIAETLHLRWTGIDFRLTPEGRYVFLEANPSPMFLGFESRSKLPITEALLDLLTDDKGESR